MARYQDLFIDFDTVNSISIYHSDDTPLQAARRLCDRCNKLFSRFHPESDVWRINHAEGAPVSVDEMTAELISQAIAYSRRTDGVFDISIGTLTNLWDFSGKVPPPEVSRLSTLAKLLGSDQIHIKGCTVSVPLGIQLDLGGIAKGYITDKLVELLRFYGVASAVLNLGGNVYLLGKKPNGLPWRVGIQHPKEDSCTWATAVIAEDVSVVTSGIYERGFLWNGEQMHHVLDPKTGFPAENDLAAVSVISTSSTDADVFSTAFLCMGIRNAKQLLSRLPDITAFFQKKDGQTEWIGSGAHDVGANSSCFPHGKDTQKK